MEFLPNPGDTLLVITSADPLFSGTLPFLQPTGKTQPKPRASPEREAQGGFTAAVLTQIPLA